MPRPFGLLAQFSRVITPLLTDDAVTLEKMASGTAGEILLYDASGDPTSHTTGTDGQILRAKGVGAEPEWSDILKVQLWEDTATYTSLSTHTAWTKVVSSSAFTWAGIGTALVFLVWTGELQNTAPNIYARAALVPGGTTVVDLYHMGGPVLQGQDTANTYVAGIDGTTPALSAVTEGDAWAPFAAILPYSAAFPTTLDVWLTRSGGAGTSEIRNQRIWAVELRVNP